MIRNYSSDKIFYSLLSVIFIALSIVAFTTDGTGGGGDSIAHFLIARYSWQHHALLLDHWGKPLFTIFSSTFAQFGFHAVKFFNILVTCLAVHFTYQTAKQLKIQNAVWIVLLCFLAPENYIVTFSGLTEPLFALVLILGVYFIVKGNTLSGIIILSFLPFARSEGLVILCLIFVYLLFTKKYKFIPWILFGHLFMGVAGIFVYHDILWVFNKIPYARLDSVYGHGGWKHFVVHLYFIIGPVLYFLLLTACVTLLINYKSNFKTVFSDKIFSDKIFLIYGNFLLFLFAHSAFWALGIFGSLGLSRVFVGIIPIMAIISLEGMNVFLDLLENYQLSKYKRAFSVIILVGMIFFCFINEITFIDYKHGFVLNEDQKVVAHEIVPYIKKKFPTHEIHYSDVGFAYFFDLDIYGNKGYYRLSDGLRNNTLDSNHLIIWDSWFSRVEEKFTMQDMLSKPYLKQDTSFTAVLSNSDTINYIIFTKR